MRNSKKEIIIEIIKMTEITANLKIIRGVMILRELIEDNNKCTMIEKAPKEEMNINILTTIDITIITKRNNNTYLKLAIEVSPKSNDNSKITRNNDPEKRRDKKDQIERTKNTAENTIESNKGNMNPDRVNMYQGTMKKIKEIIATRNINFKI